MNVSARRPTLLPTSVVGSHGLPGWVWLAREALEAGRLGALDVRAGVEAKLAVHVCFGNLYGRPFSAVRDYRNLFGVLGDLKASQVVLEFANRGLDIVKHKLAALVQGARIVRKELGG